MKKDIFIIDIHSFIDVITNSSTELFVCNSDKTVGEIEQLIREKEAIWPTQYGEYVHVDNEDIIHLMNNKFNVNWYNDADVEETIGALEFLGYEVSKPAIKPNAITISCERGCMDRRLVEWLEKTFNTELISC